VRVLVLGATGFIGARLSAALAAAGHDVLRGVRRADGRGSAVRIDFARDLRPEDWIPHLHRVDVVVNAVGVLREHVNGSFAALHDEAPSALFHAAAGGGVARVVQISALGAEPHAASAYFRSKAAADARLVTLPLDWVIMQPSLVFGPGGASATLLSGLATLPVIPLPGRGEQRVQPIHVDDLVGALVRLVESRDWSHSRIAAVGPEPLALRELLTRLRAQLGLPRAPVVAIPMAAMRVAARIGGWRPHALLDPDTLAMLAGGSTAPADDIAKVLGAPPRPVGSFVMPHEARDLATAGRLWWLLPLLRAAVAVLWIASGLVSFGIYPLEESRALLARVGLVGGFADLALYGAALLDVAFGVAIYLVRRRRWLWRLQIAVIVLYSAIIAIALPEFWVHPFAPMVKNLPLLAALALLHELDD
jgi:uncharacterized protein YbjT (DUF2867 family)